MKNKFIKNLFAHLKQANWVDVEAFYFKKLLQCKNIEGIKKLNADFTEVRLWLIDYLNKINKKFLASNNIQKIIDSFLGTQSNGINYFINFNYTEIICKYTAAKNNNRIINLHGVLNDVENPPIFGYSPIETEYKKLKEKTSDYEIMKFVKDTLYLKNNNKDEQFQKFIRGKESMNGLEIKVIVLGHSMGASDEKFLRTVISHPDVSEIEILKYNDENYFDQISNIYRIDASVISKIVKMHTSKKFPQITGLVYLD